MTALRDQLAAGERDLLVNALRLQHGNVTATARNLGVSVRTLWRRIAALGLVVDRDPPVAICACGRRVTAIEWALGLLGVSLVPAGDDGPAYTLEQSNCPACHSTLGREIKV